MGISFLQPVDRVAAPEAALATAYGHAGEVLQGAFRAVDGVHRFLCSLPAPAFASHAAVVPTPGRALSIRPAWAWKALAAARLLLRSAGAGDAELQLRLCSNVPVAKGCGSSTADVAAVLRALRAYLRIPLDDAAIARLAVRAERASDGSVFPYPAVFLHREGRVDEPLPGEWPRLRVLVVDSGPQSSAPTLSLPRARYSEEQLECFATLRGELRAAFRAADPARLGAVATASARINQQYLAKPKLEEAIALVEEVGGYGVAAAHSGTVLSLLLPVSAAPEARRLAIARAARFGMPLLAEFTYPGA
jgi:uncharacterized protein involved in propanediol utilization